MLRRVLFACTTIATLALVLPALAAELRPVDFQRQIRPILSQNCFLCHGPDEAERKGGLRLDLREDALKPAKSGVTAIVPNQPHQSELLKRISHSDPDELMPPGKSGKQLSREEITLLTRWISEGAPYAQHWAYEKPVRSPLPKIANQSWVRNGLDYFIAERLEQENLAPSAEADQRALIRRVALDLTGLPPTIEEVNAFLADTAPDAYERMVDRMLDKQSFGEHWARMWLDLARYADSAGYADDPLRSIWAYRDYVIKAFNENKPFDQFTIEQIAGDLLPNATEEQEVATAFHRNTMTNNEGGTNDEEFRTAAVVDRVNTTMAVWMGTSIACAQCHTHKYDPITHEEYFRFYALLNNTADADRTDESPVHQFFNREQKKTRATWETEVAALEAKLRQVTPEIKSTFKTWGDSFPRDVVWEIQKPEKVSFRREESATISKEGAISRTLGPANESYTLEFPLEGNSFSAVRLQISPQQDNPQGLITRISAVVTPPKGMVSGRYVRIELPGKDKTLSLAEVQVFSGKENIAITGEASHSSTFQNAAAKLAIDGKTDGDFNANFTTHTDKTDSPWWELDLKAVQQLASLSIWNRTDNGLHTRLADFKITIFDEQRQVVWERTVHEPPNPSLTLPIDGAREVRFVGAYANSTAQGKALSAILNEKSASDKGWAPGESNEASQVTVLTDRVWKAPTGSKLTLTIEQNAPANEGLLSNFTVAFAGQGELPKYASSPEKILSLLASSERDESGNAELLKYYLRHVAPELTAERDRVAALQKKLEEMKPNTVPIFKDLAADHRRKTRIHLRGNYLDPGKEVQEGVPAIFTNSEKDMPRDRLALAQWLVSPENPLTPRVVVNRFWEQIFGVGLVRTSEEFGAQGELPSHPELLDWLASEFIAQSWNSKKFLKLLVTSAAYRQSSKVSSELAERDPENRLLARGPRFRMAAETIRDQALFVADLLSPKMYGPSVKPPQPASGLNAAFGSSVDWKTSEGEDRFRRGLYTEWRRTSPYPSMSTFDAPNREVCTIRRTRTNTPLQALVTLNDTVYLEAAQGLAFKMLRGASSVADRIRLGFELCLARTPNESELNRLSKLAAESMSHFATNPQDAKRIAQKDAGEPAELAAWTTVANVLLNLDETLMKR